MDVQLYQGKKKPKGPPPLIVVAARFTLNVVGLTLTLLTAAGGAITLMLIVENMR